MSEERDTAGWKFYQKHLNFFYTRDIEGLVQSDYHEDAELVTVDWSARGRDALRQIFTGYLEMIGDFKVRTTEKFHETDDAIMLEATMDTQKAGERKVYDIFVMRAGKITHHFTGVR